MTYAKIRYVRNLTDELYKLEKLQEKFSKNASATKTGGKSAEKLTKINKLISEIRAERSSLISEITEWFDSSDINLHEQNIFSDYFFEAKEKSTVEDLYLTNNIHHDLKKYIYNF